MDANVKAMLDEILAGMEDRLAIGMTKALDTTYASLVQQIKALEEDQARILRHLGIDQRGD